ncbi:MAG: glycoside hydrolase family 32 protein, partial [Novosphingobium sp.]|nr:glycoside hydrolase family 32 protein [Novosphingobium sp.]
LQRLALNGQVVGEGGAGKPADFVPADTPFTLAGSWRPVPMLVFNINGINAAYDDVQVTTRALEKAEIARLSDIVHLPGVNASLAVPESRFAADHLRPRFHAMPPANWTNEPHGLVVSGGRYHLFYQRTPNGPFKTQMHWGHMSSADLVNWTHHRDALQPELQTRDFGFDQKGIWSGDVIVEGGKAFAYYTSVNHGPAYNPGISVAVSEDPGLRYWKKLGPVLDASNVQDFRDPYLWKENGVWHMIIGAALKSGGGLDHYRCTVRNGKSCWERVGDFSNVPYPKMDIGSAIWEMPVFEEISGHRILLVNPIGGAVTKYGDMATRGVYWLGNWENERFAPATTRPRNLDLVPGHLSPAVARQPDGTLAAIGIVDERRTPQAQEDAGWAHTFSLPREWYLVADGRALGQRPLRALAGLREGPPKVFASASYRGATLIADAGPQAEFKVRFTPGQRGVFGIVLAASPDGAEATRIVYDRANSRVVVDKSKSTLSAEMEGPAILQGTYDESIYGEPADWHVFVDGSVVDVFIGNGAAFSFRVYPTRRDATGLGIFAEGAVTAEGVEVWTMKPMKIDYSFDD